MQKLFKWYTYPSDFDCNLNIVILLTARLNDLADFEIHKLSRLVEIIVRISNPVKITYFLILIHCTNARKEIERWTERSAPCDARVSCFLQTMCAVVARLFLYFAQWGIMAIKDRYFQRLYYYTLYLCCWATIVIQKYSIT